MPHPELTTFEKNGRFGLRQFGGFGITQIIAHDGGNKLLFCAFAGAQSAFSGDQFVAN